MQHVFDTVKLKRMACVRAALKPGHNVILGCQIVYYFTFAFIPPLRPEYRDVHNRSILPCSIHLSVFDLQPSTFSLRMFHLDGSSLTLDQLREAWASIVSDGRVERAL